MLSPRRPIGPDVSTIPTPPMQAAALFLIIFFTAAAFVVFCLRVLSRTRMRTWGLDDSLMTVAMLFSILMLPPFYLYIKLNYFGWHQEDVPQFDPQPGLWWFYLAQLFYNPVLALVKASVLFFLLRLVEQHVRVRWAIHFLNVFNALQCVAIFLVAVFQCLPIKANWDQAVKLDPATKCVDLSFHIIISCITILTDLAVLILPFWIFLGLQMPKGAKMAVLGIFLLGAVVTIIGIVRLVNVVNLFYFPERTGDPYYNIGIVLNTVEVNIAIITASAPALRPLLRTWLPQYFGSEASRQRKSSKGASKLASASRNGAGVYATGHSGYGDDVDAVPMHAMGQKKYRQDHTECRSVSPTGSEEEIMTYNGILRTTEFQVRYDSSPSEDGDASKGPHKGP